MTFVSNRAGLNLEYADQASAWLGVGVAFPLARRQLGFVTAVTALAGDGRVALLAGAGSAVPAELLVPQGAGWTAARQAVGVPGTGTVTSAALSSSGSVAVLGAPAVGGFRGTVAVDVFPASGLTAAPSTPASARTKSARTKRTR